MPVPQIQCECRSRSAQTISSAMKAAYITMQINISAGRRLKSGLSGVPVMVTACGATVEAVTVGAAVIGWTAGRSVTRSGPAQ